MRSIIMFFPIFGFKICWVKSVLRQYTTREMQGIVGQASDFVEVVSKID